MLVYAFVPLCIHHVVCNSWSRLIADNMPSAINLQSFAGGGEGVGGGDLFFGNLCQEGE